MPLQLVHEDITKIKCDAIVNPTDCFFSGGGGADLAIHTAAGPELDAACAELDPINVGEIAVTDGYNLPCRYVLHTTGPIWEDGSYNEEILLRSCYINALIKGRRLGVKSIAFPLISSGTFGFPKDRVLKIANEAVSDFLMTADADMSVYICIIDKSAYELAMERDLNKFLEKKLGDGENNCIIEKCKASNAHEYKVKADKKQPLINARASLDLDERPVFESYAPVSEMDLDRFLDRHDDRFGAVLIDLIDEKGMKHVECYKRANVSKNTFSKIKNDPDYKPSKPTVVAFAVSLELTYEETEQLLKRAGFAFSQISKFDLIVEYYIKHKVYDIFEINDALYQHDQTLLGCV